MGLVLHLKFQKGFAFYKKTTAGGGVGMAILPRPDSCGYSPPRRGDGAVTGYKNCPDTRGGAVTDFAWPAPVTQIST